MGFSYTRARTRAQPAFTESHPGEATRQQSAVGSERRITSSHCAERITGLGFEAMTDQPPIITPEQADAVILALAEGAPTLKRACADEGMPRPWQVLAHAEADPEFAARLQAATEVGVDAVHDEMVDVEQQVLTGKVEPAAANSALANKRWRMERLSRKQWGTKVEVDAKVDGTVNVNVRRFAPDASPEQPE